MKNKLGFGRRGFQSLIRLRKRSWLIAAGLILGLSGLVYAAYFQSFETDTAGWFSAVMKKKIAKARNSAPEAKARWLRMIGPVIVIDLPAAVSTRRQKTTC